MSVVQREKPHHIHILVFSGPGALSKPFSLPLTLSHYIMASEGQVYRGELCSFGKHFRRCGLFVLSLQIGIFCTLT